MTINIDDILQAIHDNADWPESMSLTKAKSFASAVRRYLLLVPQQSSQPGFTTTLNISELSNQLALANQFIADNTSSDGTTLAGHNTSVILGVVHGFR